MTRGAGARPRDSRPPRRRTHSLRAGRIWGLQLRPSIATQAGAYLLGVEIGAGCLRDDPGYAPNVWPLDEPAVGQRIANAFTLGLHDATGVTR